MSFIRRYLSIFLIFIFLFTFIVGSYNYAYADVSSTLKTEIASILGIGSLLVHAGFTFTSRDSLFAFSKKIYDTLDSGSLSNLQTFINGYKALSSLPYDTLKAIYDLAKTYLSSSSISESLSDAFSVTGTSTVSVTDGGTADIVAYNVSSNGNVYWRHVYSVSGLVVHVTTYRNDTFNSSYDFATPPSGAVSLDFRVNTNGSGPVNVNASYYDASGKLISSAGTSVGDYYVSCLVSSGFYVYPDVTISPASGDVNLPSSVDTDDVANRIVSGQAGSISAPVYAPDVPSDVSSASDVLNTNLDILLKTTTSLVDTNTQTLSAVKSISLTLSDVLSSIKSIATSLTDGLVGDVSKVNFQPLEVSASALTTKFPFSLPWDLYNVFSLLNVSPQVPKLTFNLSFGSIHVPDVSFDFSWLDPYMGLFRWSEYIIFCIGLILVTRRLFGGAQ